MNRAEACTLPFGDETADTVLNALPHPVLMVAPDGKIAEANVAAEAFFEVSMLLLRRHVLRDLVPFGSPAAGADRAGAQPRRRGERIPRRPLDAAQAGRAPRRPQRRAACRSGPATSW